MKRSLKKLLILAFIVIFTLVFYYAWYALPIISGFDAKLACTCVFVGRQDEQSVKNDLGELPFSLASLDIDRKDKSVTASVLGLAKRKALFREGLGCTLINEISEQELRSQKFALPSAPEIDPDSLDWPIGDRISNNLPVGVDLIKINQAVDDCFVTPDKDNSYTRAVVVVYDGNLIAEKYARGFDRNSPLPGWSTAKSITSALIGILVRDGKLKTGDRAPVALWKDPTDPRQQITIEHLLQQTSGLDFDEVYTRYSNVTNMLFNKGDMGGYVTTLPLKHPPGSQFYYSSGNSNVLSKIIRQTVGENNYPSFLYHELFYPLGMRSALIEPDASGTLVGSSYFIATARDYARFGLLYYQDGIWNHQRILPEGWVQRSIQAPKANTLKNYGYQFWLNGYDKRNPSRLAYPDVPRDMYYADGFGGQDIYIIPSKKLVVVRLGTKIIEENAFLKQLCEAVP